MDPYIQRRRGGLKRLLHDTGDHRKKIQREEVKLSQDTRGREFQNKTGNKLNQNQDRESCNIHIFV